MKRSSLIALLLITLTTGAATHEGKIGLYTDLSAMDIDLTFVPFLSYDITILYLRSDAGPDGITAAQFKLLLPPSGLALQNFVPSPEVSVTMGNIVVGISMAFSSCTGSGIDFLFLGTVTVVSFIDEVMYLMIVTAEDINPTNPPISVRVTICDEDRTKMAVLGGWFCSPNGCSSGPPPGTESSSWGAIKGMYR